MSVRGPAIAVFLFFTVLAPAVRGSKAADPAKEDIYTSKTHGFSIERPDESWVFKETTGAGGGTLTLAPEDSGGTVQVSVKVAPLGAAGHDPGAIRDAVLESIAGDEKYSRPEKAFFEAAGRKAPGFTLDMKTAAGVFRIRQCYLVEKGMLYTLECHARAGEFDRKAGLFMKTWKTFAFMPLSKEALEERKIASLAARCGSEIDWAKTWEGAAERARREKKLVLVLVRLLPGFNISDQAVTGPLMDPEVLALVKARFVALRFAKGMKAPFTSRDSYGMGPNSFGTSILLVTPEGEVVGDTFALETAALRGFLEETLDRHPERSGPTPPRGAKGLDLAAWRLETGRLAEAAALLKEPRTARGHRLRAALLRRLGKDGEALAELDAARTAARPEEKESLDADLEADRALVLLRMGMFAGAEGMLEDFVENHRESERLPEAMYRLGACRLRLSGKEEAAEVFKKLIASHPESRWAWKAAAALTGTAFSLGYGERLDRPPADLLSALDIPPAARVPPAAARRCEREALAFLLEHQRADGSWISPAEVVRFKKGEPDDFTEAITALCAKSLVPFRSGKGVAKAIEKATAFLLDALEKRKTFPEKVYFMDYSPWRLSCTLSFFCGLLREGLASREKLAPAMEELVAGLGRKQRKGGGWSYYVTRDLGTAGKPADQSISFVTAAVLIALFEAREAGVAVPGKMTDAAIACLEKMATPQGTFAYMLFSGREGRPVETGPVGSAGRGPLCTLALFRAGRRDGKAIRRALDLFVKHRGTYAREHRKTVMHAGPEAVGSHYLMFDYAFAAAAVRVLAEKDRGRYRKPLLEQILGARTAEGSYIDNPMIGTHYGTAMALFAFESLEPLP